MPMTKEPPPPACAHADVCGRQATETGYPYCILHDPATSAKSLSEFNLALTEHLNQGRCSLRYFRLPDSLNSLALAGRTFAQTVECVDLLPPKPIILDGATLTQGVVVDGNEIGDVFVSRVTSGGAVRIRATRMVGNTIRCHEGRFSEEVSVSIEESAMHFEGDDASFTGRLFVRARQLNSLTLRRSILRQGVSVHAHSIALIALQGTAFWGLVDLSRSEVDESVFLSACSFDPSVEVDFTGCVLKQSLEIVGSRLPQVVHLNGTTVRGGTRIEASLGSRPLRLSAPSQAPRLEGPVFLKNVDVAECRLVGNVIPEFTLSGMKWTLIPTLDGRFARVGLYDEATCRRGEGPPIADIREAYENLKEMYRQMGDHIRSGDFHYGEMEMKVFGRSVFHKVRSLEWWYGRASGYGTRPGRAFSVLVFLILGFAMIYYVIAPWFVGGRVWQAIVFSVSVATLQRPEVPPSAGQSVRSIVLAEALLGPVQIALFVLALRMRVRR